MKIKINWNKIMDKMSPVEEKVMEEHWKEWVKANDWEDELMDRSQPEVDDLKRMFQAGWKMRNFLI